MMTDADLSDLVKSAATRHAAPPHLRHAIAGALRAADAGRSATPVRRSAVRWPEWLRLGSAFACGLAVAAMAVSLLTANFGPDRLAEEAVADHVRSMMADHLTDVASSDQHTVKPWFNGKLTYSPPVHDLGPAGFPLVGGRLDYLDGRPVAALVYRHRLHAINVFVRPCQGAPVTSVTTSRQGFNVTGWCDGRMQYWTVSDLNPTELQGFAVLLREQEAAAPTPPSRR